MKTGKKPSISELLNLLDKPALLGWANRIGLEGESLAEARRASMAQGVSLHKQIERWILNKTPIQDPDFHERVEAFFSDKNIIAVEKPIDHERFTGRLDVKYRDSEGVVWICDFKTNQSRLYRENKIQLASYRMSEGCDRVAVISIPDMRLLDSNIDNFGPYEEMILHLVEIYRLDGIISKI